MDKVTFDERFNNLVSELDKDVVNKITPLFTSKYTQKEGIQSYQPTLVAKILDDIGHNKTDEIVMLCKKALLVGIILNNWDSLYPLEIVDEFKVFLERVYKATDAKDKLSLRSIDIFWKELAIARGHFFPIKSGLVDCYSGFGFKQGLSFSIFDSFRFLIFTIKFGRKPYYRTHLHTPILDHFSAKGWEDSYHQVAIFLKKNHHIKGLVRTSWYFDPNIKIISPHLNYLQELPLNHGARLFCVGSDQSGCALSRSKKRLRLFDLGLYKPMNYMLIWPRSELISWSEKHIGHEL